MDDIIACATQQLVISLKATTLLLEPLQDFILAYVGCFCECGCHLYDQMTSFEVGGKSNCTKSCGKAHNVYPISPPCSQSGTHAIKFSIWASQIRKLESNVRYVVCGYTNGKPTANFMVVVMLGNPQCIFLSAIMDIREGQRCALHIEGPIENLIVSYSQLFMHFMG